MPALEPLCHLIGVNSNKLTTDENLLLEAELFSRICEELEGVFRELHKEYFRLMKFTVEKEKAMLEAKCVRFIIHDILLTNEYNLTGIAYYTSSHEDVINELYIGSNSNPSAILLRRIIELHRSVRHDLYNRIIKKITAEYLILAA